MKNISIWLFLDLLSLAWAKTSCCDSLSKALGTIVTYPGEASYYNTEHSYWSLQEAELEPTCVVRPLTAGNVAQAMFIISSIMECNFAVKGRGHNPAAGFANIEGGITIDLRNLTSIDLDSQRSLVRVGAGAAWLDVYEFLEPYGLATAGGRNGNVGIGGLLLGGGISHFSPRVGWACDGVVNFEVVLGNGSLVHANEHTHHDLFVALKGGTGKLGIVTRFDLTAFPQGNISTTMLVHDISQRDAVFRAFANIVTSPGFDLNTSLVTGLIFDSTTKTWRLTNSAVYAQPVLYPPVFRELFGIPSISHNTILTSVAAFAAEPESAPKYQAFATATFKPSANFIADIFDVLNSTLLAASPGNISWVFALEPLVAAMLSDHPRKNGNVLGLGSDNFGFILLMAPSWTDPSLSSRVQQMAQDIVSILESRAQKKELLERFQYVNYAAPFQKPLKSYGDASLHLLRDVSRKYDPKSIFQVQVPGGFKLD